MPTRKEILDAIMTVSRKAIVAQEWSCECEMLPGVNAREVLDIATEALEMLRAEGTPKTGPAAPDGASMASILAGNKIKMQFREPPFTAAEMRKIASEARARLAEEGKPVPED